MHGGWVCVVVLLMSSQRCSFHCCLPAALTDPPDRTLYYALGPNSDGLELVRAMRGSNKNEAVNKVTEKALATTAKLRVELADGKLSL